MQNPIPCMVMRGGTSKGVYLLAQDLPSNSDQMLNVGLFLMRETASELTFDSDAIDRERGVILGEERYRNTPIRRFFNAYYTFLYPDTIIIDGQPIASSNVDNLL